jgi:LacI family transcriptional regulator
MPMSSHVNLQDVARLAKVSAMTVSRVINEHPRVSPETAKLVQEAIVTLGYSMTPSLRKRGRPSRAHKGLHTGQIAMVILGGEDIIHHPVIERTVYGLDQKLQAMNLNLIVLSLDSPSKLPEVLNRKSIDGMIVTGSALSEEFKKLLRDVPGVLIYGFDQLSDSNLVDHVMPDNVKVSQLAAKALLQAGQKHCAFFDPSPGHLEFAERGRHFKSALEANGGEVDVFHNEGHVAMKSSSEPDVDRSLLDQQMDDFLANEHRAKGIFLPSDLVTAIFHRKLREKGHDPQDYTMVSCNYEKPYLEGLFPQPYSIDIHAEEIGAKAAELLLARIADRDLPMESVMIAPELRS